MRRVVPLLVLALLPAWPRADAAPAQVTIYRCVDAAGRLSLRDSPCRKGERQEVRSMLRPVDAPPERRVSTAPATRAVAPPAAAATRVVVVAPPRPVYECTAPDGARYLSESGEGTPRWTGAWLPAYPAMIAPGSDGGYGARVEYRSGSGSLRIDSGRHWRGPGTIIAAPAYVPTGAWVRDPCAALPQAEVCARLRDRRDALGRRYHSALQSEREAILREERGIDARLAQDCGA